MNNVTQNFHWAAREYDRDEFWSEVIDYKNQLSFITDSLLSLEIISSERDACAFWVWHSGQVDAGFLDVPSKLSKEYLAPIVLKFLEKYYKE
jgi:hypothetical protein